MNYFRIILIILTILLLIIVISKKYNNKIESFNNINNSIINKSEGRAINPYNHATKLDTYFDTNTILRDNYEIDYWNKCPTPIKQKEYNLYVGDNSLKKSNLYFNANDEIDIKQLQIILNKVKSNTQNNLKINTKNINLQSIKKYEYSYWNNRKIPTINIKNYREVQSLLLLNINNQIDKIDNRLFQNVHNTLIEYKIDNKNKIERYIFMLDIYRYLKFHGFQILVDCLYDIQTQKIEIVRLKAKSIILQEKFYLNKGISNDKLDTYVNIYHKYPQNYYDGENSYVRNSSITRKLPSQKQLDQILDTKRKNIIYYFLKDAYTCYGSEGNDYYNCKANRGITGQSKKIGFWDRPCLKNEECPFYKANKNYDNTRGGCIEGVCEMPINVKLVSPRQFLNNTPPYCYNCNQSNEVGNCCNQQMKYNSKMKSPDYAFEGDLIERMNHQQQLLEKGLKPFDI